MGHPRAKVTHGVHRISGEPAKTQAQRPHQSPPQSRTEADSKAARGRSPAAESEANHNQACARNNLGQQIGGPVANCRHGTKKRQLRFPRVGRYLLVFKVGHPDQAGTGESAEDLRRPEKAEVRPISR